VNGRNSDNALVLEMLGWEPSVPLRVGLGRDLSMDRRRAQKRPPEGRSGDPDLNRSRIAARGRYWVWSPFVA
jgi:hypothetical protein